MPFTFITGASSGIGEELARQYAEKGRNLILAGRSEDKLTTLAEELKKKHSIQIHTLSQDLSQLDSAEQLFKKFQALGVEVNYLINNAGIGLIGQFDSYEIGKIQDMLLLNVVTLTKLTYLFLPQLKKHSGTILNVASQVAFEPAPYMAAYGATKAYVLNFTEALRVEFKDIPIKVIALCPGPTYTKFFEKTNTSTDQIHFKFRNPPEVVSEAIAGVESNRSIIIPGWENKIWTFFTRFLPRSTLASLSQYQVSKK